jgi:hypothetical protein
LACSHTYSLSSLKFEQFSGALADAAVRQQQDLRDAFAGLSTQMSVDADIAGGGVAQWPFFWPPQFEHTAADFIRVSKCEWLGINNVVMHSERDAFVNFTTAHYRDAYKESHMIRYGNLDKLDDNVTKYQGFITNYTAVNGTPGVFMEDIDRVVYMVRTMQSPPPRDYSRSPNWNMFYSESMQEAFVTMLEIPGSTVFWGATKPVLITVYPDEHKGFHTDDTAEHPHTYALHPFYRVAGDTSSDLVAWVIAYFAWDQPLRNLLPSNVNGLLVVVSNDCNTTFSYLIQGKDAIFQGWNDTHEEEYDNMSLHVDLSLNADPRLKGRQCSYQMVSSSSVVPTSSER